MKFEIKSLARILAAIFCCLFACNCATASIKRPNGDTLRYASVGTNYNITTTVLDKSDTGINPLPVSGGKFKGQDSLTPKEGDQEWAVIIGGEDGIKIGMQDQGTPLGVFGKWGYKIFRVDRIAKGFGELVGGYFGNKAAKVAAGVTNNTVNQKAAVESLRIKESSNLIQNINPELIPVNPLSGP